MVVKIYFQTEQYLKWLNQIVEMLKQAAVHFEVQGVAEAKSTDLRKRRMNFLTAASSSGVITTDIQIPGREERNARSILF